MYQVNVAFIHGDIQPVVSRVFESEDRHAGRSQRSGICFPFRHHGCEWCSNSRVLKGSASLCQSSICLRKGGSGHVPPRFCCLRTRLDFVELLRANGFLLVELLVALERRLREREPRFRCGHILLRGKLGCSRLLHGRSQLRIVNQHQHLAALDAFPFARLDGNDASHDLTGELTGLRGAHCAHRLQPVGNSGLLRHE